MLNKLVVFVFLFTVLVTFGGVGLASIPRLFLLKSSDVSKKIIIESRLVVTGSVQHALNLTLEELVAFPKTTVNASLYCETGELFFEGNWTGVRLRLLLERAGISSSAIRIAFYADDGYTTDLLIVKANREDVILAYELNGQPLAEKLRLVVPGEWGYKWISKLGQIEVLS
jgi:DMSO/TMAO reductase YedYZ molybdopterin-dependent catalytic subunit